jgi:hypothetical protein
MYPIVTPHAGPRFGTNFTNSAATWLTEFRGQATVDDPGSPGGHAPAIERLARAKERQEVLFSPELLASCVTAGRITERRPGPAALTARHVRHVATAQVRSHVAPDAGEPALSFLPSDYTLVSVGAVDNVANPVQEHRTRILPSAERKMNATRSNG